MAKIMVLGAGTSYGHNADAIPKPPKATDFFEDEIAREILSTYSRLSSHLELRLSGKVDIEQLFSRIEGVSIPLQNRQEIGAGELLRSCVTDIIYRSTQWLRETTCPTHDALVSSWLSSGDSVVSFNYDLILDRSLSRSDSWTESNGYGFTSGTSVEHETDPAIALFKPHGSMNWFRGKTRRSVPDFSQKQGAIEAGIKDEWVDTIQVMPVGDALMGRTATNSEDDAVLQTALRLIEGLEYLKENRPMMLPFINDSLQQNIASLRPHEEGHAPYVVMPTPRKIGGDLVWEPMRRYWTEMYDRLMSCSIVAFCGFSFRDEHFVGLLIDCAARRSSPMTVRIITKEKEKLDTGDLEQGNIEVKWFDGWLADYLGDEKSAQDSERASSV